MAFDILTGNKEYKQVDSYLGLGAVFSGTGSIVNGFDSMINGNARSRDQRKATEALAAAQAANANASIESSRILAKSAEMKAALAAKKTETIIIGIAAIVVIAVVAYLVVKSKKAANAIGTPATTAPIINQPALPAPIAI